MLPRESPNEPTRRQALAALGVSVAAAATGAPTLASGHDSALDDAYRQLMSAEPQSSRGLSTHAPMAIEALCELGFPEKAGPWLKSYRAASRELPPVRTPIDPVRWKDAIGPDKSAGSWEQANHRWADWKEFFIAELAKGRWQDALDVWVARLAPGMSGAATHGVIRTAHAVRAVARKSTPERLGELARGLAYWASSYEELPAGRRDKPPLDSFAAALDEVPLYRTAFGVSPQGRNIVEVLRQVPKVEGFAAVRDAVIVPADLSAAMSALTATFTRVYLRYGTKNDTIAFIHAVTGPTALRRLAPHMSAQTARAAFPYAWQTAAAVFCAYVKVRESGRLEETKQPADELAARAVANGDEHAIKFTEVMLAEHKLSPDPIYLAAADDAIRRL